MKSTKFFIKILAVFFTLVKPASTNANPGCIKNTSIAASSIQTVFNPSASSPIVSEALMAASSDVVATLTGSVAISVMVSVTAVTVSVTTVFCAKTLVVRQLKMSIAVAIHSFTELCFLYIVSIMIILFNIFLLCYNPQGNLIPAPCRLLVSVLVRRYRGQCRLARQCGCGWHLRWE